MSLASLWKIISDGAVVASLMYCPDVSFVTLIENQEDITGGEIKRLCGSVQFVTSKGRVLGMDKRRKPHKAAEGAWLMNGGGCLQLRSLLFHIFCLPTSCRLSQRVLRMVGLCSPLIRTCTFEFNIRQMLVMWQQCPTQPPLCPHLVTIASLHCCSPLQTTVMGHHSLRIACL